MQLDPIAVDPSIMNDGCDYYTLSPAKAAKRVVKPARNPISPGAATPDSASSSSPMKMKKQHYSPMPTLRAGAKNLGQVPDGYPPKTPTPQKGRMRAVDTPSKQYNGAPVHGRAAQVAAKAAKRDLIPVGSSIKVYWAGSDTWFETTIIGHRAQLWEEQLRFRHRCDYDGGEVEHDLGETAYEVIELTESEFVPPTPYHNPEDGYMRNYMLSPDELPPAPTSEHDQENVNSNIAVQQPSAAVKAPPPAVSENGNKGAVKKGRLSLRVLHPKVKSTKGQYENAVNAPLSVVSTNGTVPQTPSRVSDIMDRALKV